MQNSKPKAKEDMDASHQQILDGGQKRFPMESYQQLLQTGASQAEALQMLGYDPKDPPAEVQ